MLDIQNIGLVELNAQEVNDIQGGCLKCVAAFLEFVASVMSHF